jgi:hypothetical protein
MSALTPENATFTVLPGESTGETKNIDIPAKPSKADIEIAIDTTSSMEKSLSLAQADATNIVSQVQAAVPDTQFAVVQFRDAGDTPVYNVEQSMTANATDVQNAINLLSPVGGGDFPEAYNTVFQNSYTPDVGGDIGWRAGSRKFVIVLGDAQPHGDLATQGLTGCIDESSDGLVTKDEVTNMAGAQRTLLMIRQAITASTSLQCYQSVAALGYTGSAAIDEGGSLVTDIVNLINESFTTVGNVHLEVASATPAPADASWITFNPASLTNVTAPSSQSMDLTATVPASTPPGTYTFDIVALADGVDIGHQSLMIVVLGNLSGRMTGGGTIGDTHAKHGFQLHCDVSKTPNNLEVNWGKGNKFHLETLTSAICTHDPNISPNPPAAGFDTYIGEGVGRYNGVSGYTAKWTFTDAGEPGKNDFATIEIFDPSNVSVGTFTGNLKHGNHQAHKK